MAGSLILIAGLILLGYVVTDDLLYRLRPLLRRRGLRGLPETRKLNWRAYALLPITFALAYLMREGPLISIYLVALGVLSTLYYALWRTKAEEETALNAEILKLVEEFQSQYRLTPSIFQALTNARLKVDEPLREHVTAAVETFYVTASQKRAFAELRRRVPNSYLNQFVYILERSETARREVVQKALERLVARLRRREQLRVETETDLTVITGQTQIILILGIGLLFVVAMSRGLREVYTRSPSGQILFIVLATIGVLTVYYIDRRIISLKERVL
jgi:Flp pilus assembly protein TadB